MRCIYWLQLKAGKPQMPGTEHRVVNIGDEKFQVTPLSYDALLELHANACVLPSVARL